MELVVYQQNSTKIYLLNIQEKHGKGTVGRNNKFHHLIQYKIALTLLHYAFINLEMQ